MKKYLVVKEEYMDQIISVVLPGMGRVKVDTSKIGGDKSFYVNNGLGYLFEEISFDAGETKKEDMILDIKIDEKVSEIEDKPVKKRVRRTKKS